MIYTATCARIRAEARNGRSADRFLDGRGPVHRICIGCLLDFFLTGLCDGSGQSRQPIFGSCGRLRRTPRKETSRVFIQQCPRDFEGFVFRAKSVFCLFSQDPRDVLPGHLQMCITQLRIAIVPAVANDLIHRNSFQKLVQSPARRRGRNNVRPAEIGIDVRKQLRQRR